MEYEFRIISQGRDNVFVSAEVCFWPDNLFKVISIHFQCLTPGVDPEHHFGRDNLEIFNY